MQFDNLFKLPSTALTDILEVVNVDFAKAEVAKLSERGPASAQAWIAHAEAVAYRVVSDEQSMSNSLARLLEAHTIDPGWVDVSAEIAWTYLNAARRGWIVPGTSSVSEVVRKGIEFAEIVVREDPRNSLGPARKAALLACLCKNAQSTSTFASRASCQMQAVADRLV